MRTALRVLAGLALVAVIGYATFVHWRTRNIGRVQRGWRVAHEKGCFTCHGPGGIQGMANPGHAEEEVPPWSGGLITMYAQSEQEIREWILDGLPRRVRQDPRQMALRANAVIEMPAFRGLLSPRELEDLLAYVKAVSDFETPRDARADEGRKISQRMGCFNCHGPQGRGSMPNVRAYKGYIPAWDGPEFTELARDDAEIRQWILDGVTERFRKSRLARYYLERQPIKMPAYRGHLGDEEVDRIVDYIHWLRQHPY